MADIGQFEAFDFATLQALARENNLKSKFKTKGPLIRHLIANNIPPPSTLKRGQKRNHIDPGPSAAASDDESDSEYQDAHQGDTMDWEGSFALDKHVRIHSDNLKPRDVRYVKELLKKLRKTNKLTELERVQKYVFNQLGII